ncbi:MAG TPA: VIT domain-containing protein, partial [Abditibacteriaceae bacterium]
RTIEGTYVFPLPEGAAVSGFAMTVGGKRVEAEILEGDKARQIYTDIVQKMRDPGILEYIDRGLIRARIFPIAARAEQKVELEYSESLKPESGSFRFSLPLRLPVGGTASRAGVDIRITSPDGIRAVYSPTHEIETKRDGNTARITAEFTSPNSSSTELPVGARRPLPSPVPVARGGLDRDFVLYYTADKGRVGVNVITQKVAGEDGYFMLLAAPDPAIADKEIAEKDVVFVCDTSGSMSGEKIEQARRALQTLIGNLNPRDRFNIVTFSSDTRSFRDGLTTADKPALDAARDWIREIKAVGGTNINEALVESLKQSPYSERARQIVFLTDGQPTVGETKIDDILKNVRESNTATDPLARNTTTLQRARLFVFGVGYDVNTRLLDTLATENSGSSDYVLPQEDIEQKVGSLYQKIAFPVWSNPRLDWGNTGVYDVYPKKLPDLFRGSQTVVFGRFKGNAKTRVQLLGTSRGEAVRVANDVDFAGNNSSNNTLPRLWAMRKVGYLMDDAQRARRAIDPEVKDEIIKLSKKYGIVTPFTAGLITEDTPPSVGALPGNGAWRSAPQSMSDADGAGITRGSAGPAPVAGRAAVEAAKARGSLRDAERVHNDVDLRYIEGKSFVLRNGIWTDTDYDAAKTPRREKIKFASTQYFTLLKDNRMAKWLSLGERIIVVLPDKVIEIEP